MRTCLVLFGLCGMLCSSVYGEEFRLHMKAAGGRTVRYFADHPVDRQDDNAEYAVVMVHGFKGGNADCTKRFHKAIADQTGVENVLFIAPCFPVADMLSEKEKRELVYWTESQWQAGFDSCVAPGICPYDVLDDIFGSLNSPRLYQKLKHVLFCGFSAGGQIASRYVAVSKIKPHKGLAVDFAAGAPSTWLYLDDKRMNEFGKFKVPREADMRYNNWHLGLARPARYAASISQSSALRNMASRGLLCFCGTEDVTEEYLSRSPGAMLQGKTRYERFLNYRKHIARFPKLKSAVRFVEISGAGHEGRCWEAPEVVNLAVGRKDLQKELVRQTAGKSERTKDAAKKWSKTKPEEHGYDSARLSSVATLIKNRNMGTTGLMVVVGGEVIYEYGDVEEVSYIASCRKSILSMMYGKYVRNGTIDLSETVGQMKIDDVGGLLPIEKEATVLNLITARSGCYHPAANAGGIREGREPPRGQTKPGTKFLYNNWDFNVAGTVFEQKVGKSIYDVFDRDFARPLQLQDWDRARHKRTGDVHASIHLAYHFHFSTRDMARIGELMLRKGKWNGRQLVPADWVAESTRPFTEFPNGGGYGYMWWCETDPEFPDAFKGAFAAHGMYGQRITILPALDMVVAHKSARNAKHPTSGQDYNELVRMIIRAKKNSSDAK